MTTITIIQLYPKDMNLYGDWGNTLVLKKRLEWRGFGVEIIDHNPGDATDFSTGDIFVGGGGQDAGQLAIQDDLLSRGEELKTLANDGVPMLLICGMYQLFGRQFVTNDGSIIRGIGVLPVDTTAGEERLIGNITLESDQFGTIVGYENHSGQTFLDDTVQPLGKVVRGAGNNNTDGTEGVRLHNTIATYLHGSLLPKNPTIADFLIAKALERRGIPTENLRSLEIDALAHTAQNIAAERPR
jgi:possible adenosylcobyric acid synthase (glutamine-hydrolyzing)